jgi:hypothetical protein
MVLFEVDTYQNENCMVDHLNLTTKKHADSIPLVIGYVLSPPNK